MAVNQKKEAIMKKVDALVSQMTLDEKIAQIGSYWIYDLQTRGQLDDQKIAYKLMHGIGQITRNAGACTLLPVEAARSANILQRFLKENTRLGIPAILHEECCSGVMAPGFSIFPQMLGLASTFKPDLAKQMTSLISKQMRAVGIHQGLAPVLDVSRDSRWGRVEETFGEDPTLVSQFGVAYIKGLQGNDLADGVMATGKHFVGHAFSQGGLNCGPVHIGWRDLWDVYLAPFQAAIRDAGLASMMNAYPEVDGEVVAASRRILTDLLRDTLGFDGVVVSDYEAILMIHNYHHAAATKKEAAVKALNAGIDVEMPTFACYGDDLKSALESGDISLDTIELSAKRHLQKKFELGLFENPYVNEGDVLTVMDTTETRSLAYKIACQSMVLLKNDGILPLNKDITNLAVIGPNAHTSRNMMGDYSFLALSELMSVDPPADSAFVSLTSEYLETPTVPFPTILDGIRKLVSPQTKVRYARGCDVRSDSTAGFAEAIAAASDADAVIMVMGDRSGLGPACTTGEFRDSADLLLPGVQQDLVKTILKIGKPVIMVHVSGRPTALTSLVDGCSAILEAWVPGEEGGSAVAETLFGDVNPGGKLPISIPRSVGQVPIFYNYKPSGMHSNIWGDYVAEKVTPLFPFGHGLSYTKFEYSGLHIDKKTASINDTVDISVEVINSGKNTGDEVVQLYIRDEYASFPRPVKELKGFLRLELQPFESKTVVFHLPVNQLAFYAAELKLMLEAGKIQVMVGSSSEDIRLRGDFEIIESPDMEVKNRVFVCPVESI